MHVNFCCFPRDSISKVLHMAKHVDLVTGGAGFIGTHLVRLLVSLGHEVTVVDNLSSGKLENIKPLIDAGKITFYNVDIRYKDVLNEKVTGQVDHVYHLAADPLVRESVGAPIPSFEHNVMGTINVLEMMRSRGIKSMVFASSGGTLYGDAETFPIHENTILKPISPYGASKAAAEMYLSAYASSYSLNIASLRFANIFGPGSNHGVMYDFYNKLQENPHVLTILGDGEQRKSYLHVTDCVSAMVKTMEWVTTQPPGTFDAFNLGTDDWFSVTELARIMVDLLGLAGVKFDYTGGERGWTGDVKKVLLDVTRLKNKKS